MMQITTVERAKMGRRTVQAVVNRFFSVQSSCRVVLLALAASLTLVALQGCGGSGPSPPKPTDTPAPTATPTTVPVVKHYRLGYSFAVPREWSVFDLQSNQLRELLEFVNPDAAKQVDDALTGPAGEYAGHLAVKLDFSASPPVAALAGVGAVPLSDDMPSEIVIELLRGALESLNMFPVEVHSLESGTINDLPSIQGVGTADLSSQGLFNAHAVVTALRANDTAYILVVAVPVDQAQEMQQEIDQIIGSFQPRAAGPMPHPPKSTPIPAPTPVPTPKVCRIPGNWIRGTHKTLGYSFAVDPSWGVIGVKSGRVTGPRAGLQSRVEREIILRFVHGPLLKSVRSIFGENAGHVAVDIRWRSGCRFCPPTTPYVGGLVGVGAVPLSDDLPSEIVIEFLKGAIESNGEVPAKVHSLESGVTNNLPSIQSVVTVDLRRYALFNAHTVVTALRANDTAYILVVAVPTNQAKGRQGQIDQFICTFRPT